MKKASKSYIITALVVLTTIFLTCLGLTDENNSYFLKLNEQNTTWISIILKVISGLVAIIALTFGTVLFLVIKQLREISKGVKITEENIGRIRLHEDRIIELTNEITEMKNQMRDAKLTEKKFDEQRIATLVKDILNKPPDVRLVNILKDLIWRENIDDLDKLKVLIDRELCADLKLAFFKVTNRDLSDQKLIDWLYSVKIKGLSKEDLLKVAEKSERESRVFQKALTERKIDLSSLFR